MTLTDKEIDQACNEAYKKAGHNAYFANGFKMGVEFALNKQIKRFLFIYVDGEYKTMQYIQSETQEKAEEKADEGWTRIVELESDMQIVYDGV